MELTLLAKTKFNNWFSGALLLLSFFAFNTTEALGQCPPNAVCDTFTTGDIASDYDFNNLGQTSTCVGTLSLTIPAGQWVDSVSTSYDMTAASGAWMSEQRSWLYSTTTATGESSVASGSGTTAGVFNYSRSGLSFANTATGTLNIEMHAGRTWGGSGCDPSYNKVDNNTWSVIVYYSTAPSCTPPTAVNSSNVAATTADFSWTAATSAVAYEYEVRTSGAAGSGSTGLASSGSLTGTTLSLSGLNPTTAYDFYLRTDCGSATFSPWTSASSITTTIQSAQGITCATGQPATLFSDDFSTTGNWTGDIGTSSTQWQYNTGSTGSSSTGPSGAHSGSQYIYFEASGSSANATRSIISPAIDLTPGIDSVELSFWVHAYGSDIGTLNVGVSTSPTGPFTQVFTNTGQLQTGSADPWINVGVRLDSYAGQTIYLEYEYTNGASFRGDIAIDLVEVTTCATCLKPTNFATTAKTTSSVDFSWTASSGALSYEINYGSAGFTLGTGTTHTTASSPTTVSGLSAATVYDFYLRAICAPGDTSAWQGPITDTTLCTGPLAGTYTIDAAQPASGSNFTSFASAANSLQICGVSGPVTFNIATGIHTESVALGFISGSSPTNTITFDGGDSATTTLAYDVTSSQNAVILLDNAQHLTFTNLKITHPGTSDAFGIRINQDASGLNVTNCNFVMAVVSSTTDVQSIVASASSTSTFSETTAGDNLTFNGNSFYNGDYSIHIESNFSYPDTNLTITNNRMIGAYHRGFLSDQTVNLVFNNNYVNVGPSSSAMGLGLYDIIGYEINNNEIISFDEGLVISDGNFDGTPAVKSNITNNMVIGQNDEGADFNDFEFTNVYHNTFVTNSSSTADYGIYLNDLNDVDIKNNIFHSNAGYALYSLDAGFTNTNVTVDYNLYYAQGSNFVYEGSPIADLATWQTNSPAYNANSVSGDPALVDPTADLHALGTLANDAGTPLAAITTDIDGDPRSATNPDIGADEFSPATCFPSSNMVASVVGPDSLVLNWVSGAGSANYNIEYGITGFTPGTGTFITALTDTFTTVNGLSPNTAYDFYIEDSCGIGDVSMMAGPFTFNTACLSFALPYSEGFDGGFPSCWATNDPTYAFTSSCALSGQGLIIYSPNGTYAETPVLDASTVNKVKLAYYYRGGGSGCGNSPETTDSTSIEYWDGAQWVNIKNYNGSNEPTTFTRDSIIISTGLTAGLKFRFVLASGTGTNFDSWSYDSVTVEEFICVAPTNLSVANITDSAFTSIWTTAPGATNSVIEIGAAGFTLGTGANFPVAGGPGTVGVNVTGAVPGTKYDFYVATVCATGDTSSYTGPFSFYTSPAYLDPITCATGTPGVLYSEEFDNGANGWTGNINSGNGSWEIPGSPTSANTGPNNAHSGASGSFMSYEASSSSANSGSIVSPAIDLSVGSGAAQLSFWMHAYGGSIGTMDVGVSTSATGPFTNVFSWTGGLQTGGNEPWVNVQADLTAYVGQTIYLEFFNTDSIGAPSGNFDGDIAIDLVEVTTCLSCPAPTNLGITNVTATSADAFWTTGSSSNWDVQYGTLGFTLGTGTVVNATNDTTTLSGLTPATDYEFYVRDSCAVGDVSQYVGPFPFSTPCVTFTAPFTENFDATSIPNCWATSSTTGGPWVFGGPGFFWNTSGCPGTPSDHTGNAGSYAALDHSSTDVGVLLEMPDVDVSSLTTPYLEFYFWMCSSGYSPSNKLYIETYDGANWLVHDSITSATASWTVYGFDMTGAAQANNVLKVRFRAESGGNTFDFYGDNAIDDVSIIELPACPAPAALGATNITATSADVFWTTGGASNWNVEYGLFGFPLGSGTAVNAANDTLNITGLTPGSNYSFYVRDSCAVGDVSAWVGPFSFFTLCAPLTPPSTEDFTGGFPPTPCWDEADGGNPTTGPGTLGTGAWGADGFANNGTTGAIGINLWNLGDQDWALSPQYDLGTAGNYQVDFDFGVYNWSTSIPGTLGSDDEVILLISDDNRVTWDTLAIYDDTYVTAAAGNFEAFSLAAYTGVVEFAFWGTEGTVDDPEDNDIFVDNFSVRMPALCIAPSALTAFNFTTTTTDVTWTTNNSPAAGSFIIEYDTVGFTPGTGSTQVSTNDTATISGLTPNTDYDYYVRAICGPGDTSALSGPFTFFTNCVIVGLPYTETFEANSTTLSCWQVGANWSLAAAGGFGNSPSSVVFPFYNVSANTPFYAISPEFSPAPMGYQLSVDHAYATFITEVDSIVVEYSTDGGTTYQQLVVLDGGLNGPLNTAGATTAPFTPTSTQWSNFSIPIPMGTNRVRLAAISAFGNNAYFDNVSIEPLPACTAPTNVTAVNITGTSADISFTSGATAVSSIIEYGAPGFTPGTGTVVTGAVSAQTLTGLSSGTAYDACVYDICGPNDTSLAACVSFVTLCTPINSYPYLETFDATTGTNVPPCYTAIASNSNGIFNWSSNTGPTTSTSTGPGGDNTTGLGRYVYTEASSPAATGDTAILELPEFDLTSLTVPELVYWYHMYGSDITRLNLEIFNTTTSTWDSVFTIVGQQQAGNGDPWLQQRFDLSAYTTSTNLRMRFVTFRGASFNGDVALDDIAVRETPACIDPTNLLAINATNSSVVLTWASDTNIVASTVEYGPVGFTLGTGTQVTGPRTTVGTLTGLTGGTCFDFYVKDSCTTATNWIGPVTACTLGSCNVTTAPTSATGDTLGCLGGPADLNAVSSTSNDLLWMQNGLVREVGSNYLTDSLTFTNVFSVAEYTATAPSTSVGPQPSIAGAGFGNFTNGQYITVNDTIIIDSTTVRANGDVTAFVQVWDIARAGIIQRGDTFTTPAGLTANYRVPVNIVLTPGTYFMNVDFLAGAGQLFRATGGATYPYILPGLMSIDSVEFASQIRYYYTFDLGVRKACIGPSINATALLPGSNAGTNDTLIACGNNASVQLVNGLGVYDAGGTWLDDDATGALTDSIFDATAVLPDTTYNFTYIVAGVNGCPGDTATVTVAVEATPDAGLDVTSDVCETAGPFRLSTLLSVSGFGGRWLDLDASGAFNVNSSIFNPANATAGNTYNFAFIRDGNVCPNDTAIVTLTVDPVANAGTSKTDTVCDDSSAVDLATFLDATATAGGTWVDVSATGALTGSIFNATAVANGSTYSFRYVLNSACGNDSVTIDLFVDDCDVSLRELSANALRVFPNPTNSIVTIEQLGSTSTLSVVVYSASGQRLLETSFAKEEQKRLDLANLAAGVYTLNITTPEGFSVKQIVKQ